jgi:hypothetical protein
MKRIIYIILPLLMVSLFFASAQEQKPGLRNIKLGMTKDQVEKAMAEDEAFAKGADTKVTGVTIGDYVGKPSFEYNSDGALYSIVLAFDPLPEYKISTDIQNQTSYFRDIFSKKYGKPVYTKQKEFTEMLNAADFKEKELSHVYYWVNDEVKRTVSLATDNSTYYMVITITDNVLKKKAIKDDKAKEDKKKKIEDF